MGTSAIGRGTAVEEQKVKASSGDGSPGFLDSKVDGATIQVIADQLVAVGGGANFFVGDTTKDLTDASTTDSITGVGFQPVAVYIFASVQGVTSFTFGVATDASDGLLFHPDGAKPVDTRTTAALIIAVSVSEAQTGVITMTADGFDIAWVKNASPTGTADIVYLCMA